MRADRQSDKHRQADRSTWHHLYQGQSNNKTAAKVTRVKLTVLSKNVNLFVARTYPRVV